MKAKLLGCCHKILVIMLVVFATMCINTKCWPTNDIVEMGGAYGEQKLSTVLFTGTLLCYKNCLSASWMHRELHPRPLSGALVGAICKEGITSVGMSDEYGEFIIDLPSRLHALPNLEDACSIKILQVPKSSPCYHSLYASKATATTLLSLRDGIRTYTTGPIAVVSELSKDSEACTKVHLEDHQESMSW
ncbi:hypothetical protein vseg_011603 [Gypsophila vaccaria]